LKINITSLGPPGAAPVSENSIFRFISLANPVVASSVSDKPARFKDSAFRVVELSGLWRRLAERGNISEKPVEISFNDVGWPQVNVPDNYGLDGELQRHYGPVWYRRNFRPGKGAYADLVFRGVDYIADTWLNGQYLGHHEGYFAPFSFDVSQLLEEKNTLAVRVQDPLENLDPKVLVFLQYKKYIKGTMNYHDSRPGGLPGVTSPNWTSEWGQSLTTGGINQPVFLKFTGPVRIDALFVTPMDTLGNIHVALVASNRERSNLVSSFNINLKPPLHERAERTKDGEDHPSVALLAELSPGPNRIDFDITLPKPILWWPRSHEKLGGRALYSMTVDSICDNELSDSKTERFGIRTVHLDRNPWVFRVNDRPVFIKASNYIPCQHFAKVDRTFYDRDMKLLKAANLNSVGIHAHIQCPACYEATDDAGILVFQDFALQWSYDSCEETNPGFRDRARWQIAEMAYHLYNHPSVVYWACHNEPPLMFVPGKTADPVKDKNNMVLDELLETCLKSVDSSRPVILASGLGSLSGDTHVYDGSLGGGSIYDCRKHNEAGFVSEYGFWSVGHNAVRWGDTGWPPDKQELTEWSSRLSFFGSTSTFVGAPNRYAKRQAWIHSTQLYAAFLAKYQTEAFRIRRGQPIMGIRWHFFVDWWGYSGAGLVDVDRNPKMPYYWLSAAQRPLIMVADLDRTVLGPETRIEIPIFMVNDRLEDASGSWITEVLRNEKSIVITGDPAASVLGATMVPSSPGHMIALPGATPKIKVLESNGSFEMKAESSKLLETLQFLTPKEEETPASFTVLMKWQTDHRKGSQPETNWTHFLVMNKKSKLQPGLEFVP
jgi:beta-mannosidase